MNRQVFEVTIESPDCYTTFDVIEALIKDAFKQSLRYTPQLHQTVTVNEISSMIENIT